jgi:hypothetical protein
MTTVDKLTDAACALYSMRKVTWNEFTANVFHTSFTDLLSKGADPQKIGKILQGFAMRNELPVIADIYKHCGIKLDDEMESAKTLAESLKAKANDWANEIISAISKYGGYQGDVIQKNALPIQLEAISNRGGWTTLCDITYDQVPTVTAQIRDNIHSMLITGKYLPNGQKPQPQSAALPKAEDTKKISDTKKLSSELVKKLLDARAKSQTKDCQ